MSYGSDFTAFTVTTERSNIDKILKAKAGEAEGKKRKKKRRDRSSRISHLRLLAKGNEVTESISHPKERGGGLYGTFMGNAASVMFDMKKEKGCD